MHKKLNLNFDWYFTSEFKDCHLTDYNKFEGFEVVNIPHTIYTTPLSNFDEKEFFRNACYKKEIKVKKEYEGKDINIVFEGVGHKSTIYVNDDFVVIHSGGYDEFKVNISDYLKYGQTNIITVVVNASENKNIPPFGNFLDSLAYGGIYRDVYLEITDKEKIEDFFIRTPNINDSITAYCDITVTYTPVEIVLTVYDGENTLSVNKYNVNREKETLDFDVKNKENWTPENPKLYNINIKMFQEKKLLDEVNGRFGFREITAEKDGFYLNGKKITLIGLNRHGSYPYQGMAVTKSMEYKDADILKTELGVNCVRSAHIPFSRNFLDACDEKGILVIEEIPGWNHFGNEEFHKNTKQNIRSMILRDRNHPSIIMWSVRVSGAVDNFKLFNDTNEIAKSLDPTRLTFGAKSIKNGDIVEDVYGYNFYQDISKKINIKPKRPNFMIAEHTGHMFSTKIYDDESKRLKQALTHLKCIDYTLGNENIFGTIGYSMTDYNTHANFGSSDKICYSGVLDMFRNPKYAQSAYQSQCNDNTVMQLASSGSRGDYLNSKMDEMYIFTNCEYVKMFKNDSFVETFYPDVKEFPNLPHAPIKINDPIGQVLERQEKMSVKHSEKLKKIMRRAIKNNYKLSIIDDLMVIRILHKYGHKKTYIYELFRKYIIGEVNENVSCRFDGYTNENVVKSITLSDIKKVNYKFVLDNEKLIVKDTYEMTRGRIIALDQNGNVIPYVYGGINVTVTGGLDLIGPKTISFLGGYATFYVKTNQKSNEGLIKVTSDDINIETTVDIEIM